MIILNNNSGTPLYIQIYGQLKEEIIAGRLPQNSKLPSTRHLSETLNVGRNTVENAYLQLASEGYVQSKAGSGFIVQNINSIMDFIEHENYSMDQTEPKHGKSGSSLIYTYKFEYSHLISIDFPMNIWKKVSNKALASLTPEDMTKYCERNGDLELRNDLRDYLRKSRGLSCDAEQIIICSGFDYALSLLSQLLRPGFNQVAVEEPGYSGARDIFRNNGFTVVPITVEKDGLDITELTNSSAKIVYVTPSHQFPTGAVMPIQKRLLLLNWASRSNGIIIEDDYDSELRYNSRPIPSINSITKSENVVYVGTLSKALSPSLRVSYMVLPLKLMKLYNKDFKMYQCPVALVQQRIIHQFIHSGHWERHLRRSCNANKKKHDLLIQTIEELLGDSVIIHGRNAGLHILLESTQGLTEKEMVDKSGEYGVLVYPVSTFWIDANRYPNNMVLLGFGNTSEEVIINGIKQLARAWKVF